MKDFQTLLDEAVRFHGHLCMGQVVGVRLAMAGLKNLGLDPERDPKKIIAYVEIDRCATDAVAVVAHVSLGKRSLKFLDYGKMAATFVNLETGQAVRAALRHSAHAEVAAYAPADMEPTQRTLLAFQRMPEEKLLSLQAVQIAISPFDLPGPPQREVVCQACGENIMDGREVARDGQVLCRGCAGRF